LKGRVGGLKGGPVTVADIVSIAKTMSHDAMHTLADIMLDGKQSGATRVAAANAILDRGYGKPNVTVDATVNVSLQEQHLSALNALTAAAQANAATGPGTGANVIDVTPCEPIDPFAVPEGQVAAE
jgi:hypothetical protein